MFDLRTRYHATVLVRIVFYSGFTGRLVDVREVATLFLGEDPFGFPGQAKLHPKARQWAQWFIGSQFNRVKDAPTSDVFTCWELLDILSMLPLQIQEAFFWYCSLLPLKDRHDYFPLTANPFPELLQLADKPLLP
jgi:hypothetical protein